MITYSGPRRNGKTIALVEKYRQHGGIIVVYSEAVRNYFVKEYNIRKNDIKTYYEFDKDELRGLPYDNIYIDQLDEFIQWKVGGSAKNIVATFTGQDRSKELLPLYKAING